MLDFSWQELAVTGVVALVVLGPKELPGLMHTAGKFVRQARLIAHDFRMSFDAMAEEVELEETKRKAVVQADAVLPVDPAAKEDTEGAAVRGPKPDA